MGIIQFRIKMADRAGTNPSSAPKLIRMESVQGVPTIYDNVPSGHLVPKWRRINVDATSSRRIDVNTTSFWHQMPAGVAWSILKPYV